MEEHPFPDLKIDSTDFLDEIGERTKCPKCQKSRKYYCYTCYVPVAEVKDKIPIISLPLKIDIIKHPNETDGKSTSVHAAIIASEDVQIYTYPIIPDYDRSKTLLVYPGTNSLTLEAISKLCQKTVIKDIDRNTDKVPAQPQSGAEKDTKTEKISAADDDNDKTCGELVNKDILDSSAIDLQPKGDKNNRKRTLSVDQDNQDGCETKIKREMPQPNFTKVVFIDSTWNQVKKIYTDERLQDLPCVELKTMETKFWRHQRDNPATYLATIEAIYYFVKEFHDLFVGSVYNGEYDNLLFFFCFMYKKIRTTYGGGNKLLAYKNRQKAKTGS